MDTDDETRTGVEQTGGGTTGDLPAQEGSQEDQSYENPTSGEAWDGIAAAPAKKDRLPWVLFFSTLVLFIVVTAALAYRNNQEAEATRRESEARGAAEGRMKAAEDKELSARLRSSELEESVRKITAERDALAAKLKAAEAKPEAPAAAPTKKAAAKKPPKKKRR